MMEKAPGARRISASMTVEASYIMAMVLLSLAVLIRTAYFECGKTTKIMQLHWAVERLRIGEEGQEKPLPHGQAKRDKDQVKGYIDTGSWEKEIISGVYEPEEMLRKIAAFEKDEAMQSRKGE